MPSQDAFIKGDRRATATSGSDGPAHASERTQVARNACKHDTHVSGRAIFLESSATSGKAARAMELCAPIGATPWLEPSCVHASARGEETAIGGSIFYFRKVFVHEIDSKSLLGAIQRRHLRTEFFLRHMGVHRWRLKWLCESGVRYGADHGEWADRGNGVPVR